MSSRKNPVKTVEIESKSEIYNFSYSVVVDVDAQYLHHWSRSSNRERMTWKRNLVYISRPNNVVEVPLSFVLVI